MTITKDTTVTVVDGNFRILMGNALTTFYAKENAGSENSKFVLKTKGEVDRLIDMLTKAKEALKESPTVVDQVPAA